MTNSNVKIISCYDINERVDEIDSSTSYEHIKNVVSKLKKALYDNKDFSALSAPQIGENLRLFVVKNSKKDSDRFKVFLNPILVSAEGLHLSRETCLGFDQKEFIIPRRDKVHVAYQTIDGQITSESFIGPYSEVVQQMIELLDGITLVDYGLDLDDLGGPIKFDKASKKDKFSVIEMYLNNLKDNYAELFKEIQSDEKLKELNKTIDFMTGVLKGDITPMDTNKKD